MSEGRRFQIVDLTFELLANWDIGTLLEDAGYRTNLPTDASIRDINHDFQRQCLQLLLYSAEWPSVPEGWQIPRFDMQVARIDHESLSHLWRRTLRATREALVQQMSRARHELLRRLSEFRRYPR